MCKKLILFFLLLLPLSVNAGESGSRSRPPNRASQIKITDSGNIITGTNVETALQENRTAIEANTTHAADNTQAHSDYFLNSGSDIAGGGSGFTWGFNASAGSDPVITFGDGIINVSTGELQEGGAAVLTAEVNNLETVCTNIADTEVFVGTGANAGAYITGLAACAADEKIEYVPGSPDTFTCEAIGGLVDGDISNTLTASTSTLAAANDNDTSIATTSFVQQEINGAGGTDLSCSGGQCNVDNPVTAATTASNLAADGVDALTEIAQAIKSANNDTSLLVVGTAGSNGEIAKWNTDGTLTDNNVILGAMTDGKWCSYTAAGTLLSCTQNSPGSPATADISDVSVTQTELAELETIGVTTISANQWTALGGIAETLTYTELNLLDGITVLSGSNTGDNSGTDDQTLTEVLASGADGNDVGITSLGKLEFFDAGLYLDADADGVMDITSDGTLELHSNDWDISTTGAITNCSLAAADNVIEADTVATITGLAPDTQNTYSRTQYLLPYASTTTAFGEIAIGTDGQVLTSGGAGVAPVFETLSIASGEYAANSIDDDDIDNSADVMSGSFGITIDGGGSAITTGVKGFIEVPYAMTIDRATILLDQSGSIVIDVWLEQYVDYPPTDADSITSAAPPTVTTATKSEDTTLTGWTTSVAAGDIIGFNVDSITTATRAHLIVSGNKL